MINGAIARILLRYLIAGVTMYGLMTPELGEMITSDPDIAMFAELGVGAVAAVSVEAWYWFAKRMGWAT